MWAGGRCVRSTLRIRCSIGPSRSQWAREDRHAVHTWSREPAAPTLPQLAKLVAYRLRSRVLRFDPGDHAAAALWAVMRASQSGVRPLGAGRRRQMRPDAAMRGDRRSRSASELRIRRIPATPSACTLSCGPGCRGFESHRSPHSKAALTSSFCLRPRPLDASGRLGVGQNTVAQARRQAC